MKAPGFGDRRKAERGGSASPSGYDRKKLQERLSAAPFFLYNKAVC
jgi:hypothetical protein